MRPGIYRRRALRGWWLLLSALAASDSARAVDRVRIEGLERAVAFTRRSEGRWLGLIPIPSRGLVFLAGGLAGAYVASR